jgi:elongation factor G
VLAQQLAKQLQAAHERVVDAAADLDETVFADALAGGRIEAARLRRVLRGEFHAGRLVPAFCGAALWNRGVDWLLDGVVGWMPRIAELPHAGLWAIDRAGDPVAPFAGLVFKVQRVGGEVWNFVRLVRGTLRRGALWCRARSADAARPVVRLVAKPLA